MAGPRGAVLFALDLEYTQTMMGFLLFLPEPRRIAITVDDLPWVEFALTPPDVVEKLNAALRAALADSEVRNKLEQLGAEIPTSEQQTPAGLKAFVAGEIERWSPIIKAAGVTIQ